MCSVRAVITIHAARSYYKIPLRSSQMTARFYNAKATSYAPSPRSIPLAPRPLP